MPRTARIAILNLLQHIIVRGNVGPGGTDFKA